MYSIVDFILSFPEKKYVKSTNKWGSVCTKPQTFPSYHPLVQIVLPSLVVLILKTNECVYRWVFIYLVVAFSKKSLYSIKVFDFEDTIICNFYR